MQAHRTRITISEDHDIKVTLPAGFPPGDPEAIVLADTARRPPRPGATPATDFNGWLDDILRRLPRGAPSPPLDALRRENIYEDD